MTITQAAEQVLFGKTLEDKLSVASIDLDDTSIGKAITTPDAPNRPSELRLSEKGVRAQFPGVNTLDQDRSRGELLHFLANHELLASELMALVLLKFPDAPAAYRRGVFEAMREEQMHTLMYMRRMKETGLEFGQLPLNSYFWRLVSPMKSPMEFVTKLNLTFEQANLDFSCHYAKLFEQVGDMSTAHVLDKIYRDEIGHVGHGVHWLREWKNPQKTDWQSYCEGLEFPFSASKAKGLAPYNPEGRREAGLDEDFIAKLSVYSQSRGRKPTLYWFNSNAEFSALAQQSERNYQPTGKERAIEQDLELLMIAACKQDDMLVMRQTPSVEHLETLKQAGLILPELIQEDAPELAERKLGGMIPWAWSQDASVKLAPYQEQVTPSVIHQWQPPHNPETFSKHLGLKLRKALEMRAEHVVCTSYQDALSLLKDTVHNLRLKLPFSCSGRGQFRYTKSKGITSALEKYLTHGFKSQGEIIIEPERNKICDLSIHYDLEKAAPARLKGFCVVENTDSGQFLAAHASRKWSALLPPEILEFLFTKTDFQTLYHETIPSTLTTILPDYTGALGIDAMVYRKNDGSLALEPVVEVNARYTMGRLALNLRKQLNSHSVSLQILPKNMPAPSGGIPFNEPTSSKVLQAYLINQ